MRCLRSAELIVVLSAVAGIAATLPSLYAAEPSQAEARQLLDASGIQGGLVVQLGCGDGKQIAALAAAGPFLVQALDTDEQAVAAARRYLQTAGLYGKVTVDRWTGKRLPYIDNLVNLLVADEAAAPAADEMLRVLAPQGVAYAETGRPLDEDGQASPGRDRRVDPLPATMRATMRSRTTRWSARRATCNGLPRPSWSRHHDHMASMSAVVSSQRAHLLHHGRRADRVDSPAGAVVAHGPRRLQRHLALEAADRLVEHAPLAAEERAEPAAAPTGGRGRRSLRHPGHRRPARGARRRHRPHAAHLRDDREYRGTHPLRGSSVPAGQRFAPTKWTEYRQTNTYVWDNSQRANRDWGWDEQPRRIVAIEAATARVLWKYESCVAPLTLTADAANVLLHDGEKIVCLDRDKRTRSLAIGPRFTAQTNAGFLRTDARGPQGRRPLLRRRTAPWPDWPWPTARFSGRLRIPAPATPRPTTS